VRRRLDPFGTDSVPGSSFETISLFSSPPFFFFPHYQGASWFETALTALLAMRKSNDAIELIRLGICTQRLPHRPRPTFPLFFFPSFSFPLSFILGPRPGFSSCRRRGPERSAKKSRQIRHLHGTNQLRRGVSPFLFFFPPSPP